MSQKFQAAIEQRGEVSFVKLSGVIDEDNELGATADQLTGATAVIDVADIERINSCGVRDWVNWLGKVEKGGAKVVLVECSPSIVAQINLVHNFTGAGVVKSFFAPYYCPNCDLEKVLLCEARDFYDQPKFKAPTCRCDECDGVMDFDDMEDSFFAFLANAKRLSKDTRLDAVLDELNPTEGERKLRVRSNPALAPAVTPGTGPGSLPSVPSLPSMTRTPSSPGGLPMSLSSSQRWPLVAPDDISRRVVPQPQSRPAGAWILVGVLVATAIALLSYVFIASPKRSDAATSAPAAGSTP